MRAYLRTITAMAFILLVYIPQARSATINAASCAASDVQAAINSASNGDTVVLPSCPASQNVTWTSVVTISKNITLQGQGVDTSSTAITSADKTVIYDDTFNGSNNAGQLFTINTLANGAFRITGIAMGYNGAKGMNWTGLIFMYTPSHLFRIDHDKFFGWANAGVGILAGDDPEGVIDHCTFDTNGHYTQSIQVYDQSYEGVGSYGDNAWEQPDDWGTSKFLFIEDCTFKGIQTTNGSQPPSQAIDSFDGARLVFRHNTVENYIVMGHGTDTDGRNRSLRAYEIYDNTFTNTTGYPIWAINLRGGTAVIWGNTYTGYSVSVALSNYRKFYNEGPFSLCDGAGSFDQNDPTLYDSGTATSSGSLTMTDTSKNWTPNQWVGYSLINTTNTSQLDHGSVILSNTANTITFSGTGGNGPNMVFNTGDGYQIRRAIACIDQPGRGAGAMITGTPPILQATGAAGWPQEALDPIYEWNDSSPDGSTKINIIATTSGLEQGVDFYTSTQRPGYTPYTYPNPLASGLQPIPAPTGLQLQ